MRSKRRRGSRANGGANGPAGRREAWAEDRGRDPAQSRRRSVNWPRGRSSADVTRLLSSSSPRCAARRSSRRTSGSARLGPRASDRRPRERGLPLPRSAPHVRIAPRRRRRRYQARPGRRRARESAHHAQAVLAPPRRSRDRGRRTLRPRTERLTASTVAVLRVRAASGSGFHRPSCQRAN
jgi:hypothetical protein